MNFIGSMESRKWNMVSVILVVFQGDDVTPFPLRRMLFSNLTNLSFSSTVLLVSLWGLVSSRFSIPAIPLWPSVVNQEVTIFSIKSEMPAIASLGVSRDTGTVLSKRVELFSLAVCSSNTDSSASVPRFFARRQGSHVASIHELPPPLWLWAWQFARIRLFSSGTMGARTGPSSRFGQALLNAAWRKRSFYVLNEQQ